MVQPLVAGKLSFRALILIISILILKFESTSHAAEPINICDRGPLISGAIIYSIGRQMGGHGNPPSVCEEVYPESLESLKELDVSGYCVSRQWPNGRCEYRNLALPENAFDGLRNVESIDLSRSGLEKINAGSFKKVPKLKALKLSSVSNWFGMPTYDESPFQYLKSLQVLDLEYSSLGNNKTFDQKTFFKGLSALVELNLRGNNLTALHEDIFEDLTNLKVLSLTANSIEVLPSNVFSSLKNLEELEISGTSARTPLTISEDVFHGLTQLKVLVIIQGVLSTIHQNQFQGLFSLESIHLQENFLRSLPQNLFMGLGKLKSVSLRNNLIKSVSRSNLGISESVEVDIPTTP